MSRFLRSLIDRLSPKPSVDPDDPIWGPNGRDAQPAAVAEILDDEEDKKSATAGAWECEEMEPEYEEFCANFCFEPGKKLMDLIEAEGYSELADWLHWRNREAEPKAFLRLMLTLMRDGENIWDQPGIRLTLDGRWSRGGPSEETGKALKQLSEILKRRIELIHQSRPDEGEIWQLVFGS
jgi:hypothetical protein